MEKYSCRAHRSTVARHTRRRLQGLGGAEVKIALDESPSYTENPRPLCDQTAKRSVEGSFPSTGSRGAKGLAATDTAY